jgi:hypothetical protein
MLLADRDQVVDDEPSCCRRDDQPEVPWQEADLELRLASGWRAVRDYGDVNHAATLRRFPRRLSARQVLLRSARAWWLGVTAERFFATFAAVLIGFCSTGCTASHDRAKAQARIVFLSNRLGTWAGYSANVDGTDLRSLGLTNLPVNPEGPPVWSPDGAVLSLTTGPDLDVEVVVLGKPGSRHKLGCGIKPSWSADGSSFVAYCGANLYIVHRGSWRARTIEAPELVGAGQAISPDGKEVAYVAWDGIATMHADGTGRRIAVDWARSPGVEGNTAVDDLQWSPDGMTLAYTIVRVDPAGCCGRPGGLAGGGLFLVSSKGGNAKRVLAGAHDAVAWSPDGDKVAVSCGNDLCAVGADGKHPIRLAASAAGEKLHSPVWSPDSRRVVYLRNRFRGEDESDVFVVHGDGRGDHRVTRPFPHGGSYVSASWATSPISLRLIKQTPLRAMPVSKTSSLRRAGKIAEFTANADRAVWIEQSGSRCWIGTWRPGVTVSRTAKMPSCTVSYGTGENTKVSRLELGNVRAIWLSEYTNAHDDHYESLTLAAFTQAGIRLSSLPEITDPHAVLGLVAGGPSIVYATAKSCNIGYDAGCHGIDTGAGYRVTAPQLWRLDEASREPRLIAAGQAALVPAAVGEGRIVIITPAGRVALVGLDGRPLARFRFTGGPVLTARVSGDRLVLLRRNGFIEDWSVSRNLRLRRWPAWSQASTPPLLEGAQANYAVYVAGMTIHVVKLSNGVDRVIPAT